MNINTVFDNFEEHQHYLQMYKMLSESTEDVVVYEDSDKSDVLGSLVSIAFIHLIKYEIIKQKQDTDWIDSIHKMHRRINRSKLKTNDYNKVSKTLDIIYSDARKMAKAELISKGYTQTTDICPVDRPSHYNLDFLFDEKEIDKYLSSISYSREVRDYYKLPQTLTSEQKEAMIPKYSIREAFPKK